MRARELSHAMRTWGRVTTYAVMLAEPLPDRETERLLSALGRLGLEAETIFVNRVLILRSPRSLSSMPPYSRVANENSRDTERAISRAGYLRCS